MRCDSVRSLVMCNLFSHALSWLSAWPPARSGFLFSTLSEDMSEAEDGLRTMTNTSSAQTRTTGHWIGDSLSLCSSCSLATWSHGYVLLIDDSECVIEFKNITSRWILIIFLC